MEITAAVALALKEAPGSDHLLSSLKGRLATLAGWSWETARMCFARGDLSPPAVTSDSKHPSAAAFFFTTAASVFAAVSA